MNAYDTSDAPASPAGASPMTGLAMAALVVNANFDELGYCERGQLTLVQDAAGRTDVWRWESSQPHLVATFAPGQAESELARERIWGLPA